MPVMRLSRTQDRLVEDVLSDPTDMPSSLPQMPTETDWVADEEATEREQLLQAITFEAHVPRISLIS
jgi:hypothetical protein